jgi:TPR repeat protein
LRYCHLSADQGYHKALYFLGNLYATGEAGIKKDYEKVF